MLIIGSFVQDLERQESKFQSNCSVKRSKLQADVIELEGMIANGCDSKSISCWRYMGNYLLLEIYSGKEQALLICNHRSNIDWLVGWVVAQVAYP
jgi:hypothetical protein